MNTWILDTAIARLLSTNAVVLTESPNSQIVGNSEVARSRHQEMNDSPVLYCPIVDRRFRQWTPVVARPRRHQAYLAVFP